MSLLDSLLVSIFGIAVVFIVLIVLSLIIRLQSALINLFSRKSVVAASSAGDAPAAAVIITAPAAVQEPAAVQSSLEPVSPKAETAVRTGQDSASVRYPSVTMGSKKYNAFVNGKTYELEVEEVDEDIPIKTAEAARKAAETLNETKPVAVIKPAAQPETKPAAAQPAVPAATVSSGDEIITTPVPGVVLDIKTSVGAKVKRGEVLLLIEAMKMENEIVAAKDGEVKEILITKGASVGMGTPLVVLH